MSKRSPRLVFSDDERASPKLKKVIRKADKAAAKLDKAEAKIPKSKLTHAEKKPPSKLTYAVCDASANVIFAQFHREMRESGHDNVGVESAHKLEETAESGVRFAQSAHRSHRLKPYRAADCTEVRADRANIKALNKEAAQNPQFSSNPYSRWQQKRAIKKEYAAAKAGKGAPNTVKASDMTAKAAKKAAEKTKKVGEFIARNKKVFLIVSGIAIVLVLVLNIVSSCSVMFQGGVGGLGITTYPSSDEAIHVAEQAYTAKETALQNKIDIYELTHTYDEYRYSLDVIGHDPYVLTSILSAIYGKYTLDDVRNTLERLFSGQYILTEHVTSETRYRTENRTEYYPVRDPATGAITYVPYTYTVEMPYTYTICTVTLKNAGLESLIDTVLTDEQKKQYEIYMTTQGNRPDLFEDGEP